MTNISKLIAEAAAREEEARKDKEALKAFDKLDPDALARVMRMMGSSISSNGAATNTPPNEKGVESHGDITLSEATREAVDYLQSNFNASLVRDFISKKYPALKVEDRVGTLSSILSGMLRNKKIVKVSGQRGVASFYRKEGTE